MRFLLKNGKKMANSTKNSEELQSFFTKTTISCSFLTILNGIKLA